MKNRKQKRNAIGLGMIWIVGILVGYGAEREAPKDLFEDSSKEVRQEDIVPMYCYEAAEQEGEEQEEREALFVSGPLMEDSVLDLGNHIVAYYHIVDGEKEPYIVLRDLETNSYLYIPKSGDIETVMNVALSDTGVELRYMDRHGEIHDTEFPVIFPFGRGDVIDITYHKGGIKKLNYTDAPFLPEVVWEDNIKQKDEYHKISLERVSQLYDIGKTRYEADYRLAVKDVDGNIICSQKMTIPYAYEEVYWLLDISGDGCDDIVFCSYFEDSSKYANTTTLEVLIWDEASERFLTPEHSYYYVGSPQWNQEHSVIIYDTDGFNDYVHNTEMYVFRDREWQLYADLAAHNEPGNDILFFSDEAEAERFYKGLDYYYIETFPLNEIPEQRLEEEELQDKSAVWKIRNDENNLKLYPTEGWELTSFDSGDEGAVKWKKQKQEDAFEDSSKEVKREDIGPVYCYEAEKQEREGQAYCYEAAEQEDKEQEDPSGIAEGEALSASEPPAEDVVLDLENHIVAYYIVDEWEGPNIVLEDLETGSYLYIPIESGYVKKILNVTLSDTDVELSYIRGGDGAICDMKLPVVFPFERGDVIDISSSLGEKILRYVNAPPLPDVVWEDEIKQKDKYHKISLERISMLYAERTEWGGYAADYRLTVKDMEGNIICSQKVGMGYTYEEVYWLLDVSGDGYDDIVFCTYYDDYSHYMGNTGLRILIWNEEEGRFDLSEELPVGFLMGVPQWNQEHSAILFSTLGYNYHLYGNDRKMYVFRDGEWQLYADLVIHSETEDDIIYFPDSSAEIIYYMELDFYYVESVYENGKTVFEQRLEDEEVEDKSVIWKVRNDENNLQLYPEEGWERISFYFSSSKGTFKWIKKDEK